VAHLPPKWRNPLLYRKLQRAVLHHPKLTLTALLIIAFPNLSHSRKSVIISTEGGALTAEVVKSASLPQIHGSSCSPAHLA
jgi:hypothetical protein